MRTYYFDNAASTMIDPAALDAMMPFLTECYANAHALHTPAQRARAAVQEARESVAELLGAADPSEVIFTSGATEGNNQVVSSFCDGLLVSSAIEHPSVANPCAEAGGSKQIPVLPDGTIDFDAYEAVLKDRPALVSVMLVNNEIGAIQDIDRIGEMAQKAGAAFHSDVTQGIGKSEMRLSERPIDYAVLSGHKIHAPKGVGALWARTGAKLRRFMVGGTHEVGRRSGTTNVPSVVALGVAAKLMHENGLEEAARIKRLRDTIVAGLMARVPDVRVNGQENGAPHILSVSFYRTEGESVIINMDAQGFCLTAGSACSSGTSSTSRVLTAIGLPEEWLRGTVRISLSRFTTEEEVEALIAALAKSVGSVRSLTQYAAG
jgi:cysteine desulfurase